jgi:anaerobic magnesium-protoporphyrin IX monomethyl ester cyclase
MKIIIVDIYPTNNFRLVKDTAGGYGTGNNFGDNFFSKALNFFVGKMISMPPMSAMYCFSILENQGHVVEYLRTNSYKNINFDEWDYVIVPSSIIAHETEVELIKYINKKKIPSFVIGIFANIKYKEYNSSYSLVIKGEPESFFLKNNLKKINYEQLKSESEDNFLNPLVENLDDLPYPAWDKYIKKYPLKNNFLSNNSNYAVPILATRGCPYSCFNYCTYPLQQGRKVRFRDPIKVIDEIEYWMKKISTNKFIFRDPVFSINRNYTEKICNEIINRKIKIDFLIETHLKNLDEDLIKLLKNSGLKMVYVGIESVDDNVLKDMKRFTINTDKQYDVIKLLKDNGIITKSMFMLGNPTDTHDSLQKTITYAKKLPHELVQFSVFTPYPGTPIFNAFRNKIIAKKFEKFNQYNLVFKHDNFTDKTLRNFKSKAYKEFYLNIFNFFKILKYMKSYFN